MTCTITNTDNTPSLKLVKVVTNNDGGTAVADDWDLSAATAAVGFTDRNFTELTPAAADATAQNVYAGKAYTLTKAPNPGTGYSTTGEWSCTTGGTLDATNTIVTVALGAHVTCTITNTDNTPSLKLVKVVTNNDGGTAVANDWDLSAATAAVGFTDRNFTELTPAAADATAQNVYAGKAYTLTEAPNPGTGYSTTGEWSCTTGGTLDATNTIVTIALGAHVTCTITNTDNTPSLKLVKVVTNNDGGTAVANDWDLSAATAAVGFTDRNFTELTPAAADATAQNVYAGKAYTLTEAPNPGTGYSTTGEWSCTTGGTLDATNTIVTVALGAHVTCTITNTDNTPSLKLVKVVTNNDGGTAVANDWDLSAATAAVGFTDRNFTELTPAAADATAQNVYAGKAYTLTEAPNPGTGYSTTGEWSCTTGGTLDATNTIVTVALGAHVTCTITNTDNTPSLKLVKVVTNNDGGTAVANDWDLSAATAAVGFTDRNFTELTPAAADATAQNVYAGKAYTLTEAPNPGTGYSTTGEWSCTTGGTLDATNTIVTVALGAHVTCTITNTDNTPSLKLVKVVTNNDGGTAVANDWDLSAATAAVGFTDRNFTELTPAAADATAQNVYAGKAYTLTEAPNPGTGYSTTGEWSCTTGGTLDATNTIVTVALGAHVTCTITNTDNTPSLKLVKVVTNNDGGTAVANDWDLSAATAAVGFTDRNFTELTPAAADATAQNVYAGKAYTLTEAPNPGTGYSTTGEWSCTTGGTLDATNTIVTVALGAHVTCTITNEDIAPKLIVIKHVINDDGGTAEADDFTMSVTATNPSDDSFPGAESPGTTITLNAGTYSVRESGPLGYAGTMSGDCSGRSPSVRPRRAP